MSVSQAMTKSVKDLPQEYYDELENYIESLDQKKGSLIHVLHKAQDIFGFLPMEVQLFVGRSLGISGSEVFGVVSFYSYFTTTPVGEYTINVCMGTACFVRNADKVYSQLKSKLGVSGGETTGDKKFTLKEVRCIGACGLAPIITIGDKVYGHVEVEDVDSIIDSYYKEDE